MMHSYPLSLKGLGFFVTLHFTMLLGIIETELFESQIRRDRFFKDERSDRMFGNFFGYYLLKKDIISATQYEDILEEQKHARVKLGLLAVESGLLSQKQADEVNQLQMQMDKRFGDIAVSKGYLTDAQVGDLLKKQGDAYLLFVQSLTEKNLLSMDEIQREIDSYQSEEGFTTEDIEAIKSGDLDKIVPVFLKESTLSSMHKEYVQLVMRNLLRFADTQIRMEQIQPISNEEVQNLVCQNLDGDHSLFTSFSGEAKAMLKIASGYAGEDFEEVDEDSMDAICEFLNVSNGLFVSAQSENGVEIDLAPPVMNMNPKKIQAAKLYKVSVYLSGHQVNIIFSVDTDVEVA